MHAVSLRAIIAACARRCAQAIAPAACTLACILVATSAARAQESAGTINVTVNGALGEFKAPRLVLREIVSGSVVEKMTVNSPGRYVLHEVPFASYVLRLEDGDVVLAEHRVTVASNLAVAVVMDSLRVYHAGPVPITADRSRPARERTGTHTFYTAEDIQALPTVSAERGIETVLLNTPGVVPDEDGRMHVRGEDAQLQYVVDGIPITTNLTRVYSSLFSSSIIKSVDIQTGGLRAEYGTATAAVLAVTTKSGFDRPFFANARGSVGSFGTRDAGLEAGATIGGSGAVYVAGSLSRSDRYLDPIVAGDPIHDLGESRHLFAKANMLIGSGVDVKLLGTYNTTTYQVPNGAVRTPAQSQEQTVSDVMLGVRMNIELGESSLLSVLGFSRGANAEFTSGGLKRIVTAQDSITALQQNEKFFIGADRSYRTNGAQIEFSTRSGWFDARNDIKVGAGGEIYPVKEFFTFAVTNPALSNPDSSGGDIRYRPYDISQGGTPFLVDATKDGHNAFAYAQDRITLDRWVIDAGVRFDMFDMLDQEIGISPRLGASYMLNDDLVLRGSYNRIVMQAPVENILVSSSEQARLLTGAEQGTTPTNVRSERSHNIELGAAWRLNDMLSFDVAAYGKLIENFIVKVELGNSGIIFPVNLRDGMVAGGEVRATLREWNNFSATLSVGSGVALGIKPEDPALSPIAAGLILGEEGKNYSHPFAGEDVFPTEHNQLLTSSFTVNYRHPSGIFLTLGGRFDSGLPFDLTGPNGEGLSPAASRTELRRRGYSDDVIDLLALEMEEAGSPDKSVAPHVTLDLAAGVMLRPLLGFDGRATLTVTNLLNSPYLYKFESSFGGTHFGQPRMIAVGLEAGL